MESKKNINSLMNNKNGFLITCVCSIVLLLTLCYFGINSSFKGTSAASNASYACKSNYSPVESSDGVYCCPMGYDQVVVQGSVAYCFKPAVKWPEADYAETLDTRIEYDDSGVPICVAESGARVGQEDLSCSGINENWSLYDKIGCYADKPYSEPMSKLCTCYSQLSSCATVASDKAKDATKKACFMKPGMSSDGLSYVYKYYWGTYGEYYSYDDITETQIGDELSCKERNCAANGTIYNGSSCVSVSDTYKYNIEYELNGGSVSTTLRTFAYSSQDVYVPTPKKYYKINYDANGTGATISKQSETVELPFQTWYIYGGGASIRYSLDGGNTWLYYKNLTSDERLSLVIEEYKDIVEPGKTVEMVAFWRSARVNLPTVTKEGYTCSWNTNKGGTGANYESGKSGVLLGSGSSNTETSLYAVCVKNADDTTTCPAGQYYYGQGECNVCPENYYCPERTYVGEDDPYAGTSGWMACPAGTSSPKGSDNIDDCVAQNSNFNSASVKITGTNKVGEKLTATVTTDPTGAKCTYQWYYGTSSSMTATSGSTAISGATSNTYFITDNMVDKYIYVIATCVKDGYNEKKVSDITDTVVAAKVVTGGTCSGSVEYNYTGWDKNGDGLWTVEGNNNECNDATVSGKLSVWNSNDRCCLIRDRYSINYNYNGGKKGGDDPNFGIVDGQITTELGYYGYDYVSINYPSKKVIITGNQNNTGADVGAATSANQTFAGWTFNGNTSSAKYGTSSSSITTVWSSTSTKVKAKYFRNLTTTSGATVMMTAHWTPVSLYVPTLTSPSGYTCVWNTKSDGSGRTYTSGEQYTPTENSEANITLYARCAKNDIQEPTTKVATIPTAASYCQTLTYNKTTQTLTKAAGDGYTFANNTRVNAGSQKVRAVLMSGYQWSDGTTTYKEFSCSIAKANPTLSLAEYRVSLTEGGSSSVDYSYGGDGVVGCDSRNTSIAVCEEKNGKLVITAKAAGITEILLTATSGINYNSSSTNAVSVTVVEDTSDIPKEEILTATFNANGGVLSGGNNRFCKKTSSSCDVTDLPTATRDGYTFKGWGIGNTCNSGEKEKITLNKDTSYYACWVKVENTPSVDDDGNVEDNVQTGNVVIMLVLCLGLLAMGYAYYYFKSIKQN